MRAVEWDVGSSTVCARQTRNRTISGLFGRRCSSELLWRPCDCIVPACRQGGHSTCALPGSFLPVELNSRKVPRILHVVGILVKCRLYDRYANIGNLELGSCSRDLAFKTGS